MFDLFTSSVNFHRTLPSLVNTLISFYKQPVYKQQYSNLKIDKQLDTQILNA